MLVGFNIKPLWDDNKFRGTGVYTDLLFKYLKKRENNNFKLQEFDRDIPKNADLIHYPFFDPFFLTLPVVKRQPTIVTVHDLIPLIFPDKFPKGIKGEIKWRIQKYSLSGAKTIITDSFSSKKDISTLIGLLSNIKVIYLAANPEMRAIKDKSFLSNIIKEYNLPNKFLLYVGDINWNKNIYGLLSAFSLLKDKLAMHKEKLCDPLKLVLVGGAFLNFSIDETRKIQKLIKDLKIENDVIMPGFVENAKLAAFYSLAVCYIQPSFYEGFGLPVLDALICGCPVVCSKNSSLSEVGGHFVTYFNPDDIYDMADKIGTIVEIDASSRRLLILKGIGWANNFSWNKVADDTIKCYQEAYKNL